MWLFLLAARHRMQALSALACCVGCAFSGFASLKIALFIQPLKKRTTQFLLLGRSLLKFNKYSAVYSATCEIVGYGVIVIAYIFYPVV